MRVSSPRDDLGPTLLMGAFLSVIQSDCFLCVMKCIKLGCCHVPASQGLQTPTLSYLLTVLLLATLVSQSWAAPKVSRAPVSVKESFLDVHMYCSANLLYADGVCFCCFLSRVPSRGETGLPKPCCTWREHVSHIHKMWGVVSGDQNCEGR